MKKRITTILMCMLMCLTFVLAGCDLFPRNVEEYLKKSVCTITYQDNHKLEITTEDFINAYNSYGSSLIQNGSTYQEAASQTVDVLISRFVLLEHAKKTVELDADDNMEILDDVYSALKSNLDSFVSTVRKEWDITEPTIKESEEEDIVKYKAYERTAEVVFVDGAYKIKLIDTSEKQSTYFSSLQNVIDSFVEYANPTDTTNNAKLKKESYRRFITALKNNEKGRNLSTDTTSVLKRYAEKLEKSNQENKLISKLEEYYKADNSYSTISVRQVLNKYKSMMLASKYKYETNNTTFDTAMLDSFGDVNYVVSDDYFFVSHILIKFTETEANEYKNLASDPYISREVYNQKMKNLVEGVKAKVRDNDGKIVEGESVLATDVLTSLKSSLSSKTDEQKAEIFKNAMYKYGEDPGTQNAEYMYVIGKDSSRMVESFTNASRELDDNGTFGEISELVPSEYGVHIIFYAGKVQNLFTISDVNSFNLEEEDIEKLTSAKLSVFNNKTVFDKVFALLSDDNYSIFENMNLNVLKKDLKIEKHKSVYENL